MAKKENGARTKGAFGTLRFSVAKKYVFPNPRRSMMIIGWLGCLGVAGYLVADFFLFKTSVTSSGPLSSNHATFEKDCTACHVQFKAVTNENCSVCHEKTGDSLGVYSFAAHDVYRSGDLSRIKSPEKENPCTHCHVEHEGRTANITSVPDSRCVRCHNHGPFESNHPQFEFAAMKIADDSTLSFPHIKHVKEVVKRQKLVDVERACLYCHNPQPDGKHFAPIDFDRHCDTCHLTTSQETPPLKIKSADDPLTPGVEMLESIRAKRTAGTTWAAYANPNEFKIRPGNRVVKSPIYHEDPWILENLKMLRRTLYPDPGFADLLKTSGKISSPEAASQTTALYKEAIQTLRDYATGLRGRPEPEVQADLAKIDLLLKNAERTVRHQTNGVANFKMLLPNPKMNPSLTSGQIDELNLFIDDLTKPCQQCHVVAEASIRRVRKDQQILSRAEFDHRAHILHRRCLECHAEIPILQAMVDSSAVRKISDHSAIQNIPKIENCVDCHNAAESSNRCITCHFFHPNKTNRSSMLLYLE